VLENLCISAERNFNPKHPLAVLLKIPCKLNAGIIDSGIQLLLPPGSIFDTILAVSSNSLSTKLLPYLANTYNWTANYLSQSLSSRGVADIPGFAFAEDAGALYGAFFRYACTYLNGVYDSPRALAMDDQLAKFLGDVGGGGPAAIGGFPEPSAVLEGVESLAEVVAQVRSITGALVTLHLRICICVLSLEPGPHFAKQCTEAACSACCQQCSAFTVPLGDDWTGPKIDRFIKI